MSTGENLNANGAVLSADMIRGGFHRFPQSTVVFVNPAQWSQIAPIQIMSGYPFTAFSNEAVPSGELWYVGTDGTVLGRIVNVGNVHHLAE